MGVRPFSLRLFFEARGTRLCNFLFLSHSVCSLFSVYWLHSYGNVTTDYQVHSYKVILFVLNKRFEGRKWRALGWNLHSEMSTCNLSPPIGSKSTVTSTKNFYTFTRKSGVKTKSDFVRARLLGETFKVIVENPSTISYLERLTKIVALTNRTGLLYIDWS